MRKLFSFFYIAGIVLALVVLCAPPLIIATVKRSVAGVLPGADVSIKACGIWPPGSCTLSGITIQNGGMYRVSIPAITAWFSLGGGIRIADFQIDALKGDARLRATAALALRAWGKEIREVSLHIRLLEFSGVHVTNASVETAVGKTGSFVVEKLTAGKFVVNDIQAAAALDNNTICLENLSARVLGGSVTGNACVVLSAGMPYRASIYPSKLDMAAFISDFGLADRIAISGIAGGTVAMKGSAAGYELLSGDLNALQPGGVLNIRDQSMIDMIAQRSGQARDLIRKSFTDYRYDQALARLSTEENKLVLDVAFQGEGGKRILKVVLHDFTVQGGGL